MIYIYNSKYYSKESIFITISLYQMITVEGVYNQNCWFIQTIYFYILNKQIDSLPHIKIKPNIWRDFLLCKKNRKSQNKQFNEENCRMNEIKACWYIKKKLKNNHQPQSKLADGVDVLYINIQISKHIYIYTYIACEF